MAGSEGGEKTHDPSERRKEEFRERGDLPRSQELTSAAGLILAVAALTVGAPGLLRAFQEIFSLLGQAGSGQFDHYLLGQLLAQVGGSVARGVALPLAILWVGALVAGLLMSQGNIPEEPIKIRWEVLNVFAKMGQGFSKDTWVQAAKSILKMLVLGFLVFGALRERVETIPLLCMSGPSSILGVIAETGMTVMERALPLAVILGLADFGYQIWNVHEKMKMTLQEVKDEHKDSDGNPQMKAAQRARARKNAAARAVQAVKNADVLITNPTHYAIALRYRPSEAPAPVVLAKGVDLLAQRMKAEARRHDIPRIENRPLARALYAAAKEGRMIPDALFGPVAKVLAVVLKRRKHLQGNRPSGSQGGRAPKNGRPGSRPPRATPTNPRTAR
jgi:flagellar biosynthetic protein FlhB